VSETAQHALATAQRLEHLLEQEFQALRARDLPQLERLTEAREALLAQLLYLKQTQQGAWHGAAFSEARARVDHCQALHKRNELLLARQLDAVRQALGALQKSSDDADLYDRLGQLARRRAQLFKNDA